MGWTLGDGRGSGSGESPRESGRGSIASVGAAPILQLHPPPRGSGDRVTVDQDEPTFAGGQAAAFTHIHNNIYYNLCPQGISRAPILRAAAFTQYIIAQCIISQYIITPYILPTTSCPQGISGAPILPRADELLFGSDPPQNKTSGSYSSKEARRWYIYYPCTFQAQLPFTPSSDQNVGLLLVKGGVQPASSRPAFTPCCTLSIHTLHAHPPSIHTLTHPQEYVHTHFSLLREDFVRPLREAILLVRYSLV